MIKVVSLFSGGGGLDLGFIREGYEVLWANDVFPEAVNTYRQNIGNHIHLGSLSDIDALTIPKADLIIGGPPCQAFSLSGKRDPNDIRAKLVWDYIRVLKTISPKCFLFENVVGLKSAKTERGTSVLEELEKEFNELGYLVSWKIVNAADYGIPQRRKRLILVGVKGENPFVFPAETHNELGDNGLLKWVSSKEALNDLPEPDTLNLIKYTREPENAFQRASRANSTGVTEHFVPTLSKLDLKIIKSVPCGGNYQNVPPEIATKRINRIKETGGRTTCYGRLEPDKPAYTITTYFDRPNSGCNIHYSEDRTLTVREAMRLQTFPDNYILVSNSKRKKNLIVGNAVPPMLSEVFARELKMQFFNGLV